MVNPRHWNVLGNSRSQVFSFAIPQRSIDPGIVVFQNSPPSDVIMLASKTQTAAALLRFARFPATRAVQLPSGYRVTFFDFAFFRGDRTLAAVVTLNESMQVIDENLSFTEDVTRSLSVSSQHYPQRSYQSDLFGIRDAGPTAPEEPSEAMVHSGRMSDH
jgi:hypothetical protein